MFLDFQWSDIEKKAARNLFQQALQNELSQLMSQLREKVNTMNSPDEVWEIHHFLSFRRKEIDLKYDYRYSVLPRVFGQLLAENLVTEEDIKVFSVDKQEVIKRFGHQFFGDEDHS
jgi:hypothetical protein